MAVKDFLVKMAKLRDEMWADDFMAGTGDDLNQSMLGLIELNWPGDSVEHVRKSLIAEHGIYPPVPILPDEETFAQQKYDDFHYGTGTDGQ